MNQQKWITWISTNDFIIFIRLQTKGHEKRAKNIHKNWVEIYLVHSDNCATFLSIRKCNIFQNAAKIFEHRNSMR